MMNIGSSSSEKAVDGSNEFERNLDTWIHELYNDDFLDPALNFSMDELMAINPFETSHPNISSINSGCISGVGGSADKTQSGIIPQEKMTVSSSTSRQEIPVFILTPLPKSVSTASSSSQTRRTLDLPHFPNQKPPTHPSMVQSTSFMNGHQNNNQQTSSSHLRPCPRPMSTIQTSHLINQQPLRQQNNTSHRQHHLVQSMQNVQQNQNQTQLQFQNPTATAHLLMPEGGQNMVQGAVIGEGHRIPLGNITAVMSAPVGFSTPNQFSCDETWREYAFRQVVLMKERYMRELLTMHRNAMYYSTQETNMEIVKKYDRAKEFLEKMIKFLNTRSADMIPKNNDRVYNYMNFVVNYINAYRMKNGGPQNFDQVNQATSRQSPVIIDLEANNIVNMNPQPVHQPTSSQRGPLLQPNVMPPPNNPPQRIPNREATMMNFNQNFPSRRPQGRIPTSLSNGSFQVGPATPLRIGPSRGTQQHSNTSSVNLSGSSMSLLKAATTANFPSRQFNHQPSLVNHNSNSQKMKQLMHKPNELTEPQVGQSMSPLSALLGNQFDSTQFSTLSSPKPIIQHAGQHSVSSWQGNAYKAMSTESIANSPFLLGSSFNQEKQYSPSGLSSLSTVENQRPEIPMNHRPEIPIIAGLFKNQEIIKNDVSDMCPPTSSPCMDSLNTSPEKKEDSEEANDPHLRLLEAVKSLSPKAIGSSIIDIGSVKKDLDVIPSHKPLKPAVVGDIGNITNFLMKADHVENEMRFDSIYDDEPANLDHLDLGEECAFLSAYENEPEQKVKRKLSLTSASSSLPDICDYDDIDQFFSEEWDMESTVTSMRKKPKTECKNGAILEEIKEINSRLVETTLEVKVDLDEDKLKGPEGIIVTCQYRNVCFPDLFPPHEGASSHMRPEFRIQFLVPLDYPAFSPTILNGSHNVLSGPCVQLYEETMSKFNRAVRELPEKMSLGDMARSWDACARSVFTEFAQKRGAESFSTRYGTWESSSGSS